MDDFILDIEVKVTVKPVSPKVGLTQRGPYERNLFVVRESKKVHYVGDKTDVATMVANAIKPISRQWPLGTEPPVINSVNAPSSVLATTATLNANVTDKAVAIGTGDQSITVDASESTFTRAAGSFLDDGFLPGMTIDGTGFTNAGNNSDFVIDTVTDTVITVVDNTGMVDEAGGGNENFDTTTTAVLVEWGTDPNALSATVEANQSPLSGLTATAVTFSMTGLTASTKYYYRVKVIGEGQVVRSELKTFTTAAA